MKVRWLGGACAALLALLLSACSSSSEPEALEPTAAPTALVVDEDVSEATATALPQPQTEPTATAPTVADQQPLPATPAPNTAATPLPGRPSGTPQTSPDTNPAWLGRGDMTDTSIELVWAVVDGADSYSIHRFNQNDVADPEAANPTDTNRIYQGTNTNHLDTTVVTGERYWYTLVAVDGDVSYQRWTQGHAVTDTSPPAVVTGLTADWDQAAGTITLTWDQSSDDYLFARYAIRRGIDGEDTIYYGTGWTIDQTTFVDDQLPVTGGTVTYELIATDFHDNRSTPTTITVPLR